MSRQGKRISLGLLWVLIALMPLLFVGNSIFRDALRYDEVRSVSHSIERISNDFEDIDRDALEKHTGGIVDRLTYFTFDTFVSHLNERGFTPGHGMGCIERRHLHGYSCRDFPGQIHLQRQ